MSSRERAAMTGRVQLGDGCLRFTIDRLAELQEATSKTLPEVIESLRQQDMGALSAAVRIGAEEPVGEPPVLAAFIAVTEAINFAMFGPDGPPETATDTEEGGDGDSPPPRSGNGKIKSASPSPA